jgi:molybdopterin converting factor small subunit
VVTVQVTRHLFTFFPALAEEEVRVEARTVAELVQALERRAPGIAFYLCDELGRLRTHVNIFVGVDRIKDRRGLGDPLSPGDTVHILQALSGG